METLSGHFETFARNLTPRFLAALHINCIKSRYSIGLMMRHGRAVSSSAAAGAGAKLGDMLLVASISRTLSERGTGTADLESIPLSESLVVQILGRSSLDISRKLEFFRWCSLRHDYKHSVGAYSRIFGIVCGAGAQYLDQVPLLVSSMKDDGVVVGSETFKLLLDSLIRAGKFDSALEILDRIVELGTDLNSSVYNSVLVAVIRKNQLDLALSLFFKLLGGDEGQGSVTVLETNACNQLLVALRKADMKIEFRNVFEKLRAKKDFELDTQGYNICIHAFGCWGNLGAALNLFKEMKEKSLNSSSFGPDLCTYNSIIRALCLVGKVKDALTVWEELKGSGHEPDAFTYRILIQGCTKSYRMDEAMRIFNEMHYHGFCPDTIVYNTLLNGLFKARKVMEACQLFEKMVEDGVRATCWTHNIVICGLFRNGKAVAGYTLFCDLKRKGQFVDEITYSIVVLQLCREGLLEEALQLVEEMETRGFVVDLVTITSLMIGFHKQGRWDWTERLMKHIRDSNLVLHVLNWKANMEASIKAQETRRKDFTFMFPSEGNMSEIMSLISSVDTGMDGSPGSEEDVAQPEDQWSSSPYLDQLACQMKFSDVSSQLLSLSRGQRVQAKGVDSFDIDMVNTYLSIFLAKGRLSLACKLFEIFSDMDVDPVLYSYNSMMTAFVKKGYFNAAWGVLHEMGEKVCPPDIATYSVIIQGLGKMGRADLASAVLDTLMKQGGHLDIVMYNTLINVLGKARRIDEATKLFEQMRNSGINPDVVTFNTLIEIHAKAGQLKAAYKFLKLMLDAGCSPNHVTDTTLDFLGKEIEKLRYKKASIIHTTEDDSS